MRSCVRVPSSVMAVATKVAPIVSTNAAGETSTTLTNGNGNSVFANGCSASLHHITVGLRKVQPSNSTTRSPVVNSVAPGSLRWRSMSDEIPCAAFGFAHAAIPASGWSNGFGSMRDRRSANASAISRPCAVTHRPEALMQDRPPFFATDSTMRSRYCFQLLCPSSWMMILLRPGPWISTRGVFSHGATVAPPPKSMARPHRFRISLAPE